MIYTGYVKITPGKPQTGRVKLNFHQVPGRLNFHSVMGINPLVRVSLGLLQKGVFLSVEKTKILFNALIISRLYNCNSLWVGLPNTLIYRLQLEQNCAARLIWGGRKFDFTPLVKDFYWLPAERRVVLKDIITYHLDWWVRGISTICFMIMFQEGLWGHHPNFYNKNHGQTWNLMVIAPPGSLCALKVWNRAASSST